MAEGTCRCGREFDVIPHCVFCGSSNLYAREAADMSQVINGEIVVNRGWRCRRCGCKFNAMDECEAPPPARRRSSPDRMRRSELDRGQEFNVVLGHEEEKILGAAAKHPYLQKLFQDKLEREQNKLKEKAEREAAAKAEAEAPETDAAIEEALKKAEVDFGPDKL